MEKLGNPKRQAEALPGEVARSFSHHRDGKSSHYEKYRKTAILHELLDDLNRHQSNNPEPDGAKSLKSLLAKSDLRLNVAESENAFLSARIKPGSSLGTSPLRLQKKLRNLTWS